MTRFDATWRAKIAFPVLDSKRITTPARRYWRVFFKSPYLLLRPETDAHDLNRHEVRHYSLPVFAPKIRLTPNRTLRTAHSIPLVPLLTLKLEQKPSKCYETPSRCGNAVTPNSANLSANCATNCAARSPLLRSIAIHCDFGFFKAHLASYRDL